jgi:DNA-binding NtrC family response regulator
LPGFAAIVSTEIIDVPQGSLFWPGSSLLAREGARTLPTCSAMAPEAASGGTRLTRILLVEDDADVRPSIEQLLLAAGYAVDGAGTFAGGSALLALSTYDLVITDAMLEDGNGIDIANAAKSRGIKALVLTGYAAQFPLELLEQHPCLGKPVRGEELLRVVARYLEIDTS